MVSLWPILKNLLTSISAGVDIYANGHNFNNLKSIIVKNLWFE
jgi:hypothetical protein